MRAGAQIISKLQMWITCVQPVHWAVGNCLITAVKSHPAQCCAPHCEQIRTYSTPIPGLCAAFTHPGRGENQLQNRALA